jgi:hypothetical protein
MLRHVHAGWAEAPLKAGVQAKLEIVICERRMTIGKQRHEEPKPIKMGACGKHQAA